jgi:fumarate reductase flavoprotein subunit
MNDAIRADVVIIGAGATGLAAAVSAAEHGAKVIVFEKEKTFGGTGNFFDGVFAAESNLQRADFVTYTKDQAFKNIMEYSHWLANPRLVRAIVDESGDTIDWLISHGVEFYGAKINLPDSPRTYHVVKGQGAAAMMALATKAKALGVDLRLNASVTQILKEGSVIAGVVAEQDGEEIEVDAKAVIIGSGGYLNNKEWVKKYTGFTLGVDLIAVGNVDKMGDGLRMAWEIGAAEEGTNVLEMFSLGPVGPNFAMKNLLEHVSMQPDLWVDVQGRRFCDEAVVFFDTTVGNVNSKLQDGVSYRLFDTTIKQRLIEHGIDKNGGMENPPGTKLVNLEEDLRAYIENSPTEVFEADSIEELAGKIAVDPAVLRATTEEYNASCAKGYDDLFAKDRRWLRPLLGPKFYAIKARTIALGTKGGIKINENMEVIDKKWNVIPGLYAGGFDAGGMYGDSYSIAGSSGLSSGYALNSGRIAGRNAAKYAR